MFKIKNVKLAMFIDADNFLPAEVEQAFDHLGSQNISVPIRHAHGGHEKLAGMKDVLRKHAVRALSIKAKEPRMLRWRLTLWTCSMEILCQTL